jgi:hypothetical protein
MTTGIVDCLPPSRPAIGIRHRSDATWAGNGAEVSIGTMDRYDPLEPPDPEEWLAMDEDERIQVVEAYHRRARVRLPRAKAHAVIHAIVENQIALAAATPVQRTAERLMAEGLDRHDALHAIGARLAEHMSNLMRQPAPDADPNAPYYAALERLTAESWRRSG